LKNSVEKTDYSSISKKHTSWWGGVTNSQESSREEEHGEKGNRPHLVGVLPGVASDLEVGLRVLISNLVPGL
jgi:hypothetical protein